MRLGTLKAIGHNVADSFAGGLGLMIGVYSSDVFGEAARAEPGFIEIDFLSGNLSGVPASPALKKVAKLYAAALPEFCRKHGAQASDFAMLRARFGTDPVAGRFFRVVVKDSEERQSDELYLGIPGRKPRLVRASRHPAAI